MSPKRDGRVKRKKPAYAKELTPVWDTDRWKTTKPDGEQKYFNFPITRDGYNEAIKEFRKIEAAYQLQAEDKKPHAAKYKEAISHRREVEQACADWLHRFTDGLEPNSEMWKAIQQSSLSERPIGELFDHSEAHLLAVARFKFGRPIEWAEAVAAVCADSPTITDDDFAEFDVKGRTRHFERLQARMQREIRLLTKEQQKRHPRAIDDTSELQVVPDVRDSDSSIEDGWTRELLNEYNIRQRYRQPVPAQETVNANASRYLKEQRNRVISGKKDEISLQRYGVIGYQLSEFREQFGEQSAKSLNESEVSAFVDHIESKVTGEAKTLSPSTADGILKTTRRFLRWLWRERVLESLPRNEDKLSYSIPPNAPVSIPVETVKQLLSLETRRTKNGSAIKTSERSLTRMKLFFLLMLNCGMTQKDISDLKNREVDWRSGWPSPLEMSQLE